MSLTLSGSCAFHTHTYTYRGLTVDQLLVPRTAQWLHQVNLYGRKLVLVDADGHTREFYASKGIRLGDPILPLPDPEPVYEASVYSPSTDSFTGGDGDEDLVSRSTSLIPSPPRKIRGEDVMFRYTAELK